jgi:hypothetical protein
MAVPPLFMVLNRAKFSNIDYSEECGMRCKTRIGLADEKSPQIRWSRNSKFIGVNIQYRAVLGQMKIMFECRCQYHKSNKISGS